MHAYNIYIYIYNASSTYFAFGAPAGKSNGGSSKTTVGSSGISRGNGPPSQGNVISLVRIQERRT